MPGCGYICPNCNDSGFDEDGKTCDWCKQTEKAEEISDEDWMNKVHEGHCCGDIGVRQEDQSRL